MKSSDYVYLYGAATILWTISIIAFGTAAEAAGVSVDEQQSFIQVSSLFLILTLGHASSNLIEGASTADGYGSAEPWKLAISGTIFVVWFGYITWGAAGETLGIEAIIFGVLIGLMPAGRFFVRIDPLRSRAKAFGKRLQAALN